MYIRNYRLRKKCLDKCLRSAVSEDPFTDNMVNGSKHFYNLNKSTVSFCIDRYEGN